jgi:2-phospho-L-lactate guanylyltransferase (CobY/MobA/RfbA family)
VNADVPTVQPRDLLALLGAMPSDGMAIAEAEDGTTNALALPRPNVFAPLYGSGSAARFREHAASLRYEAMAAAIPNLVDDVDTRADLERIALRAGPRTQAALELLKAAL